MHGIYFFYSVALQRGVYGVRKLFSRKPSSLFKAACFFLGTSKLADFGCSRKVDEPLLGCTPPGTPGYQAPELLSMSSSFLANTASDVYSLGILAWQLRYRLGGAPFGRAHAHQVIYQVVSAAKRPSTEESAVEGAPPCWLHEQCWSQRPQDRPSSEFVLAHLTRLRTRRSGSSSSSTRRRRSFRL